jgi:hypothetical protein
MRQSGSNLHGEGMPHFFCCSAFVKKILQIPPAVLDLGAFYMV